MSGLHYRAARAILLMAAVTLPLHAAPRQQETAAPDEADPATTPLDLLTFHRPNYFVSGFTRRTQVKFQFSIKYDLWPNRSGHAAYFAYSQKSLWDLWSFSDSSPFRESNYNPELFYIHRHVPASPGWAGCGLVSEQVGLDHESNGEADPLSRSWNRLVAAAAATCTDGGGRFVAWGAKLWLPFAMNDNSNLTDYVGYGEVHVSYGVGENDRWWGTGEVTLTGRKGVGKNGSVLAELTWRPGYGGSFARLFRFAPYFYAQAFTGQGETLLSYDRTQHSFRLGLALRDQAVFPN